MLKSKLFSTGIILLLTITITQAASIDGLWEMNQSNDLVEIRTTNDGLKAKFVNSSNWDYYDRIKNDIYEDRKGNRYYVKNSSRISWESRDGRRVINLEKSQKRNRRYGRSDNSDYDYHRNNNRRGRNDSYDNNEHRCTSACGSNCSFRETPIDDGLSGKWISRRRNLIAYVEYDGYNLRMKTNKGRKWTTYRRTSSRRLNFEDKWGNRIKIKKNGKLKWDRADGRREIDFRREYY